MNNAPILFYKDGLWHQKCAVCDNYITNKYKSQIKQKTCSHTCQLKGNKFRTGHKPVNAFVRDDVVGEKNTNWKGGISPIAARIRKLAKYADWRISIFERDDYTCQKCGKRGGNLNADHYPVMFYEILEKHGITSSKEAIECEELWTLENAQTLCEKCHKEKTKVDLTHMHENFTPDKKSKQLSGLNRKGGIPGRKWIR